MKLVAEDEDVEGGARGEALRLCLATRHPNLVRRPSLPRPASEQASKRASDRKREERRERERERERERVGQVPRGGALRRLYYQMFFKTFALQLSGAERREGRRCVLPELCDFKSQLYIYTERTMSLRCLAGIGRRSGGRGGCAC